MQADNLIEDTTILCYTDRNVPKILFNKVQEKLEEMEFPLVLIENDVPERSHPQLFRNILRGLDQITTKYVALAEHDCIYPKEHFEFEPPQDNVFYYNTHHLFVDYRTGKYHTPYRVRRALSGLICNRDLLFKAVTERIAFLQSGGVLQRGIQGACEFGIIDDKKAADFMTKIPYLDVRHRKNFSGYRKGKHRRMEHPYWGEFKQLLIPKGKWYQEAIINGAAMPTRRKQDTNEKRWKSFIEPLISLKEGSVVDLGCNAGFYCRKMAERGFKATGVERCKEFIRHGDYWEDQDPRGITRVEGDITKFEVPVSHYVFLANVHYWLTPEQLNKLRVQFDQKVLNVVLIGRYKPYRGHKSPCDLEYLKELFAGWVMGRVISKGKHFSVIFSNPNLVEKKVEDIFHFQQLFKSKQFLPSYNKLIDDVLAGNDFDPIKTDYFKYFKWRRFKNKGSLFRRHIRLIYSMKERGLYKEPLTIGRVVKGRYEPNRLVDGDHRLIVAKKLGIKKVICRVERAT